MTKPNKESEQQIMENTLHCTNFSVCKNTISVGKNESMEFMENSTPLCSVCNDTLMLKLEQEDEDEDGDGDEEKDVEVDTFIPFDLTDNSLTSEVRCDAWSYISL